MSLKLTFSTLPFMEKTFAELFEICSEFGIDAVELRETENCFSDSSASLSVVDIASNVCLRHFDEKVISFGKRSIDLAKKLGAKGIRVFLGNFAQTYDAPKLPIDYDGIVLALRELCDYSEIEIWVETHNEFSTGEVLLKLINDVDRRNLKIIWDIIHPIEDGETPEETMNYIGDYISHVHIKDGRKKADPIWHDFEYTLLGEGDLPIADIVRMLLKNGYDGYFSLEWENVWREELKKYPSVPEFILGKYIEYMKNIGA